jgi:hypothetical protein
LLIVAGSHVPVTPLGEVVANTGAVAPLQSDKVVAKFGTVGVVIVTAKVTGLAHNPTVGVNT